MRNPELALTGAYLTCLEGKISANGKIVPVFVRTAPTGEDWPYIVIVEIGITPDLKFVGGFVCSVLIDIVNGFSSDSHEYSLASRLGDFVLELTDKADLNLVINTAVLAGTVALPDVSLVVSSGETDNATLLWDVNQHALESNVPVTEFNEGSLADRRLIRFRDVVFQKS